MIIIAEIGINHNGDWNLAHELIRQAKICGADIAKFQLYDPNELFGAKGKTPNSAIYEQTRGKMPSLPATYQLHQWCQEEGIEFMASVFDEVRLEWIEELGVKHHKIASRTLVEDLELCDAILAKDKETFISLGQWKPERGMEHSPPYEHRPNVRYLHCVSKYPTEYQDITMPECFTHSFYTGFSDHSLGIEAALVAVGRGATVIEKHFTLSKSMNGPDHICSIEPAEMAMLCYLARRMEKIECGIS